MEDNKEIPFDEKQEFQCKECLDCACNKCLMQ